MFDVSFFQKHELNWCDEILGTLPTDHEGEEFGVVLAWPRLEVAIQQSLGLTRVLKDPERKAAP